MQDERVSVTQIRIPLGIIIIAVIMFFAALATDIFWIAKLLGRPFPRSIPLEPFVYNAFAVPDLVLSVFLYIGAFGLIKRQLYGFVTTLVAMGMWMFDSLLILAITNSTQLNFLLPCLFFAAFVIVYLWIKRALFV